MHGPPFRGAIIAGLAVCGWLCGSAQAATPEQYLWAGNVGAALEAAQASVVGHPDDIEGQELLIDILVSVGRADRAVSLARDRVAKAPSEPDQLYLLGRAQPGAAESARAFEAALRLDPNHARAHMGMGAIHVAAGRDAEALAAYTRAVEIDPTLAEAWVAIGRIHLAAGRNDAALAVSREALRHVRDEPSLYLLAASLEPGRADEHLTAAIAVAPRDPSLHQLRGDLLLTDGDAAGALAEAQLALAINPTLVDAQRTRAFASAVQSGVLDVAGYRELAAVHDGELSDPAAARERYGQLIDRYPACPIPLVARAQLALRTGNREIAGPDLERALALAPNETESQMAYGVYQLQAGRADLARPWLERSLAARPWDAGLALALGRAHRDLGDREAARAVLEQAWVLHAWNADVALATAQARVDAGDGEAAYQLVRDAMQRLADPRLSVALVTTATSAGRYDEAARILEDLGAQTGRQALLDAAARLRAASVSGGSP